MFSTFLGLRHAYSFISREILDDFEPNFLTLFGLKKLSDLNAFRLIREFIRYLSKTNSAAHLKAKNLTKMMKMYNFQCFSNLLIFGGTLEKFQRHTG